MPTVWFTSLVVLAAVHAAPFSPVRPVSAPVGASDVVASLSERHSHNRRYSAAVINTTPLALGVAQSWTIHLAHNSHRLAYASIKTDVWMPELALHSAVRPIATYVGHGNYRIDGLSFSRAGWWSISLTIESRFGTDSVAFNVIIPETSAAKPPRPLIAIIADSAGTELTDFMIPHAILSESGVARVVTVAKEPGRIRFWPGSVVIDPDITMAAFDSANPRGADYVIVPALADHDNAAIAAWIRAQAAHGATIISICEGARTLAKTGLLDGRRATTHWSALKELAEKYPSTTWVRDRRYVVDDHLITTTGVSAALPASIYLIERIAGRVVADSIAQRIGVTSWEPVHDTDAFSLTRWTWMKAAWNTFAPWRHEAIAVPVVNGVDEIAFALTIEAISRSVRGKAVTVSENGEPVLGRQGLRISVDEPGSALLPGTRQMTLPMSPVLAASALDSAIARLTAWYGTDAAELIALGMEYPRARVVAAP